MPYWGPQVQPRMGDYMMDAAKSISGDISDLLAKREQDKKEEKIHDELRQSDLSKDFTPGQLVRYDQTKDRDEKTALITSALQNRQLRQQAQQQSMAQQRLNYEGQTVAQQGQRIGMEQQLQPDQIAHMRAQTHLAEANAQAAANPSADILNLTDEEKRAAISVGKVPLRQSGKSFTYADAPEANAAPDLDKDGNPLWSRDGTLVQIGGVMKAATKTMIDTHTDFIQRQRDASDALQKANEAKQPSWWQKMLGGGDKTSTAATTSGTAPSAGQYPVGTRARKGGQWFTMTANGWQPE